MSRATTAVALAITLLAAPLGAQGRGRDQKVPPGHRPPAGMCRIWIDGVPPGQQPAPTDCATAVRNRPSNGRVIFGDDAAKPGSSNKWRDDKGRKKDDRHADRRRDRDRDDDDDRWEDRRDDDDTGWDRRRRSGDSSRRDDDVIRVGPLEIPRSGGTTTRTSRSLPLMSSAVAFDRGQRSSEVERWLGTDRVDARIADGNRDGRPERVTWVDRSGRVRQVWLDTDRDGRADRVEVYEDGRRVRTIVD